MTPDLKFDAMISQDLACTPLPCSILKCVNPWRTSFLQLAWGYCLMWLSVVIIGMSQTGPEYWPLYLVGQGCAVVCYGLLYLGFRSLRRVSRWLRVCWLVQCVDLLFGILLIGLLPLDLSLLEPPASLGYLYRAGAALCLWRGILDIQKAAQQPVRRSPAHLVLLLLLFPILFDLCQNSLYPLLSAYENVLDGALLLISFFFVLSIPAILITLSRIPRYLEQVGYAITPAPVLFSPVQVLALSLALTICLRYAAYLLFF